MAHVEVELEAIEKTTKIIEYEAKQLLKLSKWTNTAGLEASTATWIETSMKTAPPAS